MHFSTSSLLLTFVFSYSVAKSFHCTERFLHGNITSHPENTQVFSTWTGRRSEYTYSHLTDGCQELSPGLLTDSHTVVHSAKVGSLSDPTSDSSPYRFFFSVTLGYGSALAVHPAESIMKHLCALPNPVATHRCVTGIHSHHFPGPSQLLLTQFSFRHLSKQLRNNTIFILLSLNIKCMEALSKVETFVHHSHTTKYPPHPQWN